MSGPDALESVMHMPRALVSLALGASLAASAPLAARQVRAPYTPSPGVAVGTPVAGVIAFLAAWDKEPRVTVNVTPVNGKIVVLKFSDWECPACKATFMAYKPTFDALGAKIKYVEKDYPLNAECNAHVTRTIPGHEASCAAAAAMRLSRAGGGNADALAIWLFDNQEASPIAVAQAAFTVGGVQNFSRMYATALPGIKKDTDEGGALNLTGTPGYFVNGVLVKGFVDGQLDGSKLLMPDMFDAAVQHELKKAGIR
jgi:protein-disulfide isomerase